MGAEAVRGRSVSALGVDTRGRAGHRGAAAAAAAAFVLLRAVERTITQRSLRDVLVEPGINRGVQVHVPASGSGSGS
jgi:hypothetical protein